MASILNVDQIRTAAGTSAITINSSGLVIPKAVAFQVEATDTDQSYTASAYAKITWETVALDTGSYWDTTNHRYTPQVAGWYLFGGTVRVQFPSTVAFSSSCILRSFWDWCPNKNNPWNV